MDRILTVYEISTRKSIMCVLLLKPLGSGLFFTFQLIYGISYLLLCVTVLEGSRVDGIEIHQPHFLVWENK